jgi:hypothetical protein
MILEVWKVVLGLKTATIRPSCQGIRVHCTILYEMKVSQYVPSRVLCIYYLQLQSLRHEGTLLDSDIAACHTLLLGGSDGFVSHH